MHVIKEQVGIVPKDASGKLWTLWIEPSTFSLGANVMNVLYMCGSSPIQSLRQGVRVSL